MAVNTQQVAEIYVATFNRAPDAGGLAYWVTQAFGGNPSIEQIAASFFDSPEAQQVYVPTMTTAEKVTLAYQNLFNREPDGAGLAYWVSELDSGNISQSNMLIALVNGAKAPTGNPDDAAIMGNKTSVGLSFAYMGLNDVQLAKSVMEPIDANYLSLMEAMNTIDLNTPAQTFKITKEWLQGKTLYELFDDNQDGTFDSIATLNFSANGKGSVNINNEISGSMTYSVDTSGILKASGLGETVYFKAVEDYITSYGFTVGQGESAAKAAAGSNLELFVYDLSMAQELIGIGLSTGDLFSI